ncbi:Phospholipase A2, major isoenzyme [Larimichthys crocea]|uniref:Uncharacterized protein n=1 Tax=Larimichthys crocea TaxID=215358 RepID=A0ACD3QMW6_LARCR|nr:Phospholipase A2, major isoenzyme [Larimichthys crocea]
MNTFQTLFVLAACLSFAQSMDHKSVLQFRNMIRCVLPHSKPLLQFSNYGCYCGLGGSGKPVDELDRCCQVHDQCYGDALQHPYCWKVIDNPYTRIYCYKCNKQKREVTCLKRNSRCAKFICECDRKAAQCFGRSRWNPKHNCLPKDRCL